MNTYSDADKPIAERRYPSRIAQGPLTIQDAAGGFSAVCTGVTLQKVPDRVFHRTGTNVLFFAVNTSVSQHREAGFQ